MEIITDLVESIAATRRWNLNLIGNAELLSATTRRRLHTALKGRPRPRHSMMTVNVAAAYGGRDEILRAVRRMLSDHQQAGTLDRISRRVRPQDLARYLDTAGQPDLDLILRTSGEQRLSGFMLWQSATAEIYFCDVLWPDFTGEHLHQALHSYATRDRRLGH